MTTTEGAWGAWLAEQEKRAAHLQGKRATIVDLQRQRRFDVQELAILRRLLAEERALRLSTTSSWVCSVSGCPFQGQPMNKHCRCYSEAVAAHDKAVALKINVINKED